MRKLYLILLAIVFQTLVFAQTPSYPEILLWFNNSQGWPADSATYTTDAEAGIIAQDTLQFYIKALNVNPSFVTFDGVDDYYLVPDNDNLDFGTGDFSIESYIKTSSYAGNPQIYWKRLNAGGFQGISISIYHLSTDIGKLVIALDGGATAIESFSATRVDDGKWHHVVCSADRSSNMLLYVDGALSSTTDISSLSSASLNRTEPAYIGTNSGTNNFFNGSIGFVRPYNRTLTQSEVTAMYNYGHPELHETPYADRGASQTAVATYDSSQAVSDAFTVVIGKEYRWTKGSADSLAYNGTVDSTSSTIEFVATSTSGTAYGDLTGSDLIRIGEVASYDARNATSYSWIDGSGNNLHAQGSGSPTAVRSENINQIKQFKGSIAANTNTTLTNIIPKGYRIVSIRAIGSDGLTAIKIGSSSAGEQVVASTTTTGTTPKLLTLASTANDTYSESADVTLYARHDTGASGKTMNLIFILEKVNQ